MREVQEDSEIAGEVENKNRMTRPVKTLLLFLITFSATQLFGQKVDVVGEIYDKEGTELVSATVVAIYKADSTMAGFSLTNGQGKFKITGLKVGKYDIQISYLGYNQKIYPLTLTGEKTLHDMKSCLLYTSPSPRD